MDNISKEQLFELQKSGNKILVQYTASWCGPCRQLSPRLANISNSYDNIAFVKIDVDENMELAQNLLIRSVPTVIIYKGEEILNRSQGAQPDSFYKDILNNL
jgi:thioredoxin 1